MMKTFKLLTILWFVFVYVMMIPSHDRFKVLCSIAFKSMFLICGWVY
jgi:hypothetical protein